METFWTDFLKFERGDQSQGECNPWKFQMNPMENKNVKEQKYIPL